ncbi:polysaccharide deacetylase family protein [Oceanithermus sp.]
MNPWLWGGLAAGGYWGVPYTVWQWWGIGVVQRGLGSSRPELGLTFDDGPDPETTPRVLDALAGAGVRATFFVLGERAAASPGLIARIRDEGHELALHGWRHRHGWLRTPWEAYGDVLRGARTLEGLTGERPRFFRPPHGAYTWAQTAAMRRQGLIPVHWTVEAHDWHPAYGPDDVIRRVVEGVLPGKGQRIEGASPGDIVVMHDAGPGGRTTAEALPELLAELKRRGFHPKPVGELRGLRRGEWRDLPKRAWVATVDRLFDRLYHVEELNYAAHSVFRVARAPFPGPAVELADGRRLEPGTPAAELHLHSERMARAGEASSLTAFRFFKKSMADLARALQERPSLANVEVFWGVSLFQEILEPVGFQMVELPPARRRFLGAYMHFLHKLYGGTPLKRVWPKLVFIDRRTLLERYG